MTLHIPAKVLIHVWSYDFYTMYVVNDVTYSRKSVNTCIHTFAGICKVIDDVRNNN